MTNKGDFYSPWTCLAKISKPAFWFIWVTPLVYGYLLSVQDHGVHYVGWFTIAVLFTAVIETSNCVHNELADQDEDSINHPDRSRLLQTVGLVRARIVVLVGYTSTTALIVAIALFAKPVVAAMMALAAISAPLYNWGPRFKRRPGLAELAIAWATFFGFLSGWTWNASPWTAPTVLLVLTYFFGATSVLKDIPDVTGDAAVGAASLFSIKVRVLRQLLLGVIYLSPYALVCGMVAAGLLPGRFLIVLAVLPLGIVIALMGEVAQETSEDDIVVYELSFTYVHVFLLVLLSLVSPGLVAVVVALALFCLRLGTLAAGLAPRLTDPEFRWSPALGRIAARALRFLSI